MIRQHRRGTPNSNCAGLIQNASDAHSTSGLSRSLKQRLFGTTFLIGALAAGSNLGLGPAMFGASAAISAVILGTATSALADSTGAGGNGGDGSGVTPGAGGVGSGNNGGDSATDGAGGGAGGAAGAGAGGNGGTGVSGAPGAGGAGGAPNGVNGADGTGDSGGGGGGGGAHGQAAGGALPGADTTGGTGGNGGAGAGLGGGGGGGAGGFGVELPNAGGTNDFALTGGAGGTGGDSVDGNAGSGGTGGVGLSANAITPITNSATGTLVGGAGGGGGNATGGGNGGNGGNGGDGFSSTNTDLANAGTVTGGAGGVGGNANTGNGGNGGAGGNGVFGSGFTVTNTGTITGGAGGAGGSSTGGGNGGNGGAGGSAISGSDLIVINSGTLTGGAGGAFGTGAANGTAGAAGNAVTFTGGVNVFELRAGATVNGNVAAFAVTDTFRLGGTTNSTFDLSLFGTPYTGFGIFGKVGTSTWTLTNVSGAVTTFNIDAGVANLTGTMQAATTNVNNGGTLTGTGTIGGGGATVNINNGGTLTPGTAGTPGTSLNVTGNLVFNASSAYNITVGPASANSTAVTGNATLTGGTVNATFLTGNYLRQYSILTSAALGGTTFSGVTATNLPPGFVASLSYSNTAAFLNLSAALNPGGSPFGNPQHVAGAINGFFNNGGTLPSGFLPLFNLTGGSLNAALASLSGEAATGAANGAFTMTGQFLEMMVDPLLVPGRDGVAGGPALGYNAEPKAALPREAAGAYAKQMRASYAPTDFDRRWSTWAAAFGGYNKTNGDPVAASTDAISRSYGTAVGIDYRLSPSAAFGVALAGGATNWGLAQGLGGGKSDVFQVGVYGVLRSGAAYLSGAVAFANHWMSTDRTAFGGDHLTAKFNAQVYGGRLEGGYRLPMGATTGFTPYAAVQSQRFHTPAYSETDLSGGGFGLSYASRGTTDTRSELGARLDDRMAIGDGRELGIRARMAWAHDWVGDNALQASFLSLPGASFTVTGARAPRDSVLASLGSELLLTRAISVGAKFDTQLARGSQTYAGLATLRYRW